MGIIRNLLNQRFGRLIVISEAGLTKHNKKKWLCRCDCGNTKEIIGGNLSSGIATSCGCYNTELITKHGDHKSPFYAVWRDLRFRCNTPTSPEYSNYGGRGIKVAPEWEDYSVFKTDMFPSYKKGLTIDRIDVNGNYCKNNCKWATVKEQNNNKRNTIYLESPWGYLPLTTAREKSGLTKECVAARYRKGLRGADLFAPTKNTKLEQTL